MPIEPSVVLHVLAHELRTPVGIAQGYLRMLLENRLPAEDDRRRALDQLHKALARIGDLSREASALASVLEEAPMTTTDIDAVTLVDRVIADLDVQPAPIVSSAVDASTGSVPSARLDTLVVALATVIRATARELRDAPCHVRVAAAGDGRLQWLIGDAQGLARMEAGPGAAGAAPLALERGGLGLSFIRAALALGAHGAEHWTMSGNRGTVGIRLPLTKKAHQ